MDLIRWKPGEQLLLVTMDRGRPRVDVVTLSTARRYFNYRVNAVVKQAAEAYQRGRQP